MLLGKYPPRETVGILVRGTLPWFVRPGQLLKSIDVTWSFEWNGANSAETFTVRYVTRSLVKEYLGGIIP